MAALLDTLVSYVSPHVARVRGTESAPPASARADRFHGAALFADISGFTALTERLARTGPQGAERLTELLNAYFGQLVDLVNAHGGEVAKFAGDGLLALWHGDHEDLAAATARAAQCALAIQSTFRDYDIGEDHTLQLTIGIGAGDVLAAHVGGVNGQWQFLAAGDPLVQVALAEQDAEPGSVVLSPEAWSLVQDRCAGDALLNGTVRLTTVRDPLLLRAVTPVALQPGAEAALRPYIPLAVMARLDAGHTGWLAELRRLTVLFLNVQGIDTTGPTALEDLQRAMQTIQEVLGRYEGTINKVIIGAGGTECVAAFGLPPLTHEDDSRRAVQAAIELQNQFRARGLGCAIGIASGEAFCGPVGGERRREYTMIGDVVNVAARLMQTAADDLWCDEATFAATQERFRFHALPRIALKGKAASVRVYRPEGPQAGGRASDQPTRTAHRAHPLVGREEELEQLRTRVATVQEGRGGLVVLEGEAGIGKSRLLDELVRIAREDGMTCLEGAADAVEKTTPYHAWRSLFSQLFDLEAVPGTADREAVVHGRLGANAELWPLAPLLNSVLGLDFPDNAVTQHMTGKVRADNRNLLLARLLKMRAEMGPVLVALEDAHWMDSGSWALALQVYRDVPEALLVLATRPYQDHAPSEYTQLINSPHAHRLVLEPLPESAALALVCERLGVEQLPPQVATLVRDRAQGNPFFSEELAYALRDAGYIHVQNGQCLLTPEAGDLSSLSLPDTVQGVVTSRIDRLSPAQQLALKAASVIGRVFAFRALRDIYPVESDRPLLQDYLDALDNLDLTPLETPEPELAYIFKHVITQEVAYNLMLQTQRQQLHRAAAEWYEQTYAEDLEPHYPLLAHHWSRTVDAAKALHYSAKAGEQALAKGADQEAVYFFTHTLDLDAGRALGPSRTGGVSIQRARWERQLAEAHYNRGQLVEARTHLIKAMELLGWPMPETRGARIRAVLSQAAIQTLHRWFPRRFFDRAGAQRERARECVICHLLIGEIHYLNNELLPFLVNSFWSLNLAEWSGESPELLRAYGGSSMVVGAVPLHRLAETYIARVSEVAAKVDAPDALGFATMCASVYYMNTAQWEKAHAHADEGVDIFSRIGINRQWTLCLSVRFLSFAAQGEYERAKQAVEAMRAVVRRSGSVEHRAWVMINDATVKLRQGGDLEEVAELLREGAELMEGEGDQVHLLRARGLLAVVHLRQGHPYQAKTIADQILAGAAQSASTSTVFEGITGAAEVYLTLWEGGDAAMAEPARAACAALAKLAKKFRMAEARAYAWIGWGEWLDGKHGAARKTWHKALEAGAACATPFDLALAHYTNGRLLDAGDPERRTHLESACTIFEQIGARADLDRTRAELLAAV